MSQLQRRDCQMFFLFRCLLLNKRPTLWQECCRKDLKAKDRSIINILNNWELKLSTECYKSKNKKMLRFYAEGVAHDDLKFWVGLSKKKFLGLNFTSMFWFYIVEPSYKQYYLYFMKMSVWILLKNISMKIFNTPKK